MQPNFVMVKEVNPFCPVDTIKRNKSVLTHFLLILFEYYESIFDIVPFDTYDLLDAIHLETKQSFIQVVTKGTELLQYFENLQQH